MDKKARWKNKDNTHKKLIKTRVVVFIILHLGGFGSMQNTPTGRGNNFQTRKTNFEKSLLFDPNYQVPGCHTKFREIPNLSVIVEKMISRICAGMVGKSFPHPVGVFCTLPSQLPYNAKHG